LWFLGHLLCVFIWVILELEGGYCSKLGLSRASLYVYFWVMSVGSTHISMMINLRHKVKSSSQMLIRFYVCMLGIGNFISKDMEDFIEQFKINIENLTYRRKSIRIPLNNSKVLGYYV